MRNLSWSSYFLTSRIIYATAQRRYILHLMEFSGFIIRISVRYRVKITVRIRVTVRTIVRNMVRIMVSIRFVLYRFNMDPLYFTTWSNSQAERLLTDFLTGACFKNILVLFMTFSRQLTLTNLQGQWHNIIWHKQERCVIVDDDDLTSWFSLHFLRFPNENRRKSLENNI